jgi:Flp pilus assembly protein TadD
MGPEEEFQSALTHHQAGRLDLAEGHYRAFLRVRPDDARAALLFGRLLLGRGQPAEATVWLQRAIVKLPMLGQSHAALADALYASHRTDEAVGRYRWAVAVDPKLATSWHGLGRALAVQGHTEAAVEALRRAIAIDPDLLAAQHDLASAGHADGLDHLLQTLDRADLTRDARIEAGFAAASLLDRAARYEEAFPLFAASNTLVRQRLTERGQDFDPMALRAAVNTRIARCTKDFFQARRGWGVADDRPVFVVGMPRSGTTLAEQIIASHPAAAGIGEGNHIGALSTALQSKAQVRMYGDWDSDACRQLAAGHIGYLAARGGGAVRVVDKTPDNIFHLGLIAVLFPGARVVLCQRDPRDICLSCYFQDFSAPIAYATDLGECSLRLQAVDRLIAHWQSSLPLALYTLHYEALVASPEAEIRRLLSFLDLAWDPACLDFHRHGRDVRSASMWQVRNPLNAGSVGRWRHYMKDVGVLIEAFGRD